MLRSMHVDGSVRVVVMIGCLAGCQAFDPSLLDERASFGQMGGKDAGAHAPMHGGDACVAGDELCNALDDDCDGKIDEDANRDCIASHSTGVCASAGQCVLAACEAGYLDCNERGQDGCEEHTERCANGNTGVPTRDAGTGDVQTGEDEPDRGPTHNDDDDDAGSVVTPPPPPVDAGPSCTPVTEVCNGRDDDCNGKVDEPPLDCALEACVAGTPSYRGAACDRCVCQKCGANLMQCQNSTDATWAKLCRDVTECYVTNSRAGKCGNNEDCYGTGGGPCAAQINLASGGSSATDGSKAASGCAVSDPPKTACAAVTQYRDQCVRDLCMTECGS